MLFIVHPACSSDFFKASIVRVTCFSKGSVTRHMIILCVAVIRSRPREVINAVEHVVGAP